MQELLVLEAKEIGIVCLIEVKKWQRCMSNQLLELLVLKEKEKDTVRLNEVNCKEHLDQDYFVFAKEGKQIACKNDFSEIE